MILFASLAAAIALQGGWTWTLYEGEGPLVLANEVPDTPRLRATVECQPGLGVAQVSVYGATLKAGFATLTAGTASAMAQAADRDDHQSVPLRTDHPIFSQFVVTGALDIAVGGTHSQVEVPLMHRAKLRRFAELCTA